MPKTIAVQGLIDSIKRSSEEIKDKRSGNAVKYSMTNAMLGAFSVFFTQSPSFLAYQRDMEKRTGRSNANTLFNLSEIPTDAQIRNILDEVPPDSLTPVFKYAMRKLEKTGLLEEFKTDLGVWKGYLVALDGIEYFSSKKVSCKKCLTRTTKGKIRYCHCALTPVVVKPNKPDVIPLPPEFIKKQDGKEKQDCENNAAKRVLKRKNNCIPDDSTILGDDLYSRQPVIEEIVDKGYHYILVCKPQSHKWLVDWINALETKPAKYLKRDDVLHTHTTTKWNGKHHIVSTYRYAINVPIKENGLKANWVEITQVRQKDGKQIYKNSFITDHDITKENVEIVVKAGRTRWKVENENNNTLTTKGYHFKHNYGHGEKHLSTTITTLIIIAFLFHTILDMGCKLYKEIRDIIVVRSVFFDHIKTLTTYFTWESWDQLFDFMWKKLNDLPAMAPE